MIKKTYKTTGNKITSYTKINKKCEIKDFLYKTLFSRNLVLDQYYIQIWRDGLTEKYNKYPENKCFMAFQVNKLLHL